MLPMNDYRDVFTPAEQAVKMSTLFSNQILAVAAISLISLAVLLIIWMLCGLPGVPSDIPSKKYKKLMARLTWALFALIGGAIIAGVIGFGNYISYLNKLSEVQSNMKHNIEEKYGARLQDWGAVTNQQFEPKNLDQPHNLTLLFSAEDATEPVSKTYAIKFDPQTSEPFVAEIPGAAPSAKELEESARN